MKKIIGLVLVFSLIFVFSTSCAEEQEEETKIGIIKIVEHESLDIIENSIIEQLEVLGYKDGETAEIYAQSAQNDPGNVAPMMDKFLADGTDIVIAITTPVAEVALNYADQIPVIFSAVSDPIAAKLTSSLEKPDKNITGTCDAVPVEKTLDFAMDNIKNIKTFGFVYNPGEASSVANINKAKEYCKKKGIKTIDASVDSSNALQQAAESIVTKVDAIFTPTDNTVAEGISVISQITRDAKIPYFVGADTMVKGGGLAAIGIQYEDLGIETADMANMVLNGTPISDIPVKVFDTDLSIFINDTTAEDIGVTFSKEVLENPKTVIFE
ncbi:MAG: ABC transporter substrate-binding protein [Clostridiales Family XIII bacterium]|jgi:putative ABC transport system substrate-binding protein|nr:ABC transporter substrate-binding protein [Clostridiales Family XIII bacterium]